MAGLGARCAPLRIDPISGRGVYEQPHLTHGENGRTDGLLQTATSATGARRRAPTVTEIYYLEILMNALLNDTDGDRYSWYNAPEEIKQLLHAAVETWEDTAQSEQFILQALAHPQTDVDTLVSAYRYFFYKQKDAMARRLALQVMAEIRTQAALPEAWEDLQPILQDRILDPTIRLYLSAYTALGVMLARWGAYQAAIEIADRVKTLDEKDEFGAGVLVKILSPYQSEFEL